MPDDTVSPRTGFARTRAASITPSSGLSIALVVILFGAAMLIGRQLQRLDTIETAVSDGRVEATAARREIQSLRELILERLPRQPLPTSNP